MRTTYSAHDARTHLSKLIRLAGKGEEIVITKRGTPIAKLVPAVQRDHAKRRNRAEIREAIERLKNFAENGRPLGMSLRALREKGRP